MWGTQVTLPVFLETQQVVRNPKSPMNYVKRLQASADKLDGLTREMRRQAAAGVVLPISLLENAEIGMYKDALGSRFDLKDFHAIVLENGGVPLTLLETLVDAWIARANQPL